MRSPHTIGDELPLPGTVTFQTPVAADHLSAYCPRGHVALARRSAPARPVLRALAGHLDHPHVFRRREDDRRQPRTRTGSTMPTASWAHPTCAEPACTATGADQLQLGFHFRWDEACDQNNRELFVAWLRLPVALLDDRQRPSAGRSLQSQERNFLSRIRRLTVEGKRAGEGYWSPDGKRLVFQSEREPGNPFYQIYVLDLTSGDTKRISPGMGKTTCAFFRPGGSEIMFASTHLDPKSKQYQDDELAFRASGKERRYAWDYDAEMDIFTFDEKTGATKRLTTAKGYDAEGGYSPDGQWIVFSSMRDAYNRTLSAAEQKQLAARSRRTSPRSTS